MNQAREPLPAEDYLCARLDRIEVDVHIGLHPWELHPERPTRLWVDVALYMFDPPRRPTGLYEVIDYDRVRNHVRGWAAQPHTPLLETLAAELIEFSFDDERVDAVRVSLLKPDIFNETRAAGVEMFRRRPQRQPAPAARKKSAARKTASKRK